MCSMSWRRASAASSPAREGRTTSCAKAGSASNNVETSKKKPNRLPCGQTERTIRLIKITCSSQKIDQQKAARPPCPLVLKSTQISHLVKVSNPPPLTFQLQCGRLADGYSEIRCNSRKKTDYAGGFWWKARQKKKKRGAV